MIDQINLSEQQQNALGDLWFLWGNNGKKHTMANHKFIQGILERNEDNRDFYNPDPELIEIVDGILND